MIERVPVEQWPTEMFRAPIICPCGSTWTHLVRVAVGQGDHVTEVSGVGVETWPSTDGGRRGSLVRIDFWCEADHRFSLAFQFHKGMTYVARTPVTPDAGPILGALWRD